MLKTTSDSGFLLTGSTTSEGAGNHDLLIIKLDAAGDLEWTKTIGTAAVERGKSIIELKSGGYAIIGESTVASSNEDLLVVRVSEAGSPVWSVVVGGISDIDYGNALLESPD